MSILRSHSWEEDAGEAQQATPGNLGAPVTCAAARDKHPHTEPPEPRMRTLTQAQLLNPARLCGFQRSQPILREPRMWGPR